MPLNCLTARTARHVLCASLTTLGLAPAFAGEPRSVVDTSSAPWLGKYDACLDRYASRRYAAPEWLQKSAAELAAAADQFCADQLPSAADTARSDRSAAPDFVERLRLSATARLVRTIEHWRLTGVQIVPPPAPVAAKPAVPARLISCPTPDYPPAALRVEARGRTVALLDVDEQGNVIDTQLQSSSGPTREHKLLDATALKAFRDCKFDSAHGNERRRVTYEYRWDFTVEPPPGASVPVP